jgi:hypothetical protein
LSSRKQKLVGDKIAVLMRDEKMSPKQAIAVALSMHKSGRLRAGGKYVPVKESLSVVPKRPSFNDSLKPHKQIKSGDEHHEQPDMVHAEVFHKTNGRPELKRHIEKTHPTAEVIKPHDEGGLLLRATPQVARRVSKSTQRAVSYMGTIHSDEHGHLPGHYWHVKRWAEGTPIVGRGSSSEGSEAPLPKGVADARPALKAKRDSETYKRAADLVADKLRKSSKEYRRSRLGVIRGGKTDESTIVPEIVTGSKMRQGLRPIYSGGEIIGGYVITPFAVVTYDAKGNEVSRVERGLS